MRLAYLLVALLGACTTIVLIDTDVRGERNAQYDIETSKDDGSGSAQPNVRKESRNTDQGRERVQPRR